MREEKYLEFKKRIEEELIRQNGECTIIKLGNLIGVTFPTIQRYVEILEMSGFLESEYKNNNRIIRLKGGEKR